MTIAEEKANEYVRLMNETYDDRAEEFSKTVKKKVLNKTSAIIFIVLGAVFFLGFGFLWLIFLAMGVFIMFLMWAIPIICCGSFFSLAAIFFGVFIIARNKSSEQEVSNKKSKANELFNEVKERISKELGADIVFTDVDEFALKEYCKIKSTSSAVNACLFMNSTDVGLREAATVGVGEIQKFMQNI